MARIWFITGSSRCLGLAITEAAHSADVTHNDEVIQAVKRGHDKFGRIDVVTSNAGYANTAAVEDIDIGDFRAQVDANLMGVGYVFKAVISILREQRSGHIFQVSSLGGRLATPGLSAYQCAKWAVGGFWTVISLEMAPFGIRITVLELGGIKTDWADSSMQVPPVSEPYEKTVGAFADFIRTSSGTEPSIPRKVAEIVLKLLDEAEPLLRLLVGPGAVKFGGKGAKALSESDNKWRDLSTTSA